MSPPAGDWRPCKLRFADSAKADQTPLAISIDGVWNEVELVAEELAAGVDPTAPHQRSFVLRTGAGIRLQVRSQPEGKWYFRKI